MKRNHFAFPPQNVGKSHIITWAKSFRRRSTLCRGASTNGIIRRLPHPILDWAIRTEKPGLTERNFPLSAGPKTRLSEAIRYQRTVYPSTLRRTLRSYQIKHGSRPHLARHRHQQQNWPGTIYQASKNRGIVGNPRALPKSAIAVHSASMRSKRAVTLHQC